MAFPVANRTATPIGSNRHRKEGVFTFLYGVGWVPIPEFRLEWEF